MDDSVEKTLRQAKPVSHSLSLRELCALAQPLISKAGEIERFRSDPLENPHQVLNLLGMLGDLAQNSIEAKRKVLFPEVPIPKDLARTEVQSPAYPTHPAPASHPSPGGGSHQARTLQHQGVTPMIQDRKLLEALLGLQEAKKLTAPQDGKNGSFRIAELPKITPQSPSGASAQSRPVPVARRTPGHSLPILRAPTKRPHE